MSSEFEPKADPSQPVVYQIRLKGQLDSQWTDWFGGLTVTLAEDDDTLLTGPVLDQAALYGLLRKVRDLGMPLVSVVQVQLDEPKEVQMNTTLGSFRWTEQQTAKIWRKMLGLAIAGGTAFWVVNLAISLTPIAAEYRAALSISYVPMLLEAVLGGLVIGWCVSYCLLRFFDKLPTRNPISKSVVLSFAVLLVVTLLIEAPAKFLTPTNDALRYFLIGLSFNALRVLALGAAIGYLAAKLK